jgi:hypothetical protein
MSAKHRGRVSGIIYLALLGLLLATLGSLFFHFGPWQPAIPLIFAAVQAIPISAGSLVGSIP